MIEMRKTSVKKNPPVSPPCETAAVAVKKATVMPLTRNA